MSATVPWPSIVSVGLRVTGSTREIRPETPSLTHTAAPATATPDGPTPNGIWVAVLVTGSIRIKLLAASLTTHTASEPTAIALGDPRRAIVAVTEFDAGSMRGTLSPTA